MNHSLNPTVVSKFRPMCKELFIFKLTEHFKSHTLFINNIIFDFILFIYFGGGTTALRLPQSATVSEDTPDHNIL